MSKYQISLKSRNSIVYCVCSNILEQKLNALIDHCVQAWNFN